MKEVAEIADQIKYSVDKIKDLRQKGNECQVLVGCKGYSLSGDTWEPVSIIYEDLPGKVQEFLKSKRSNVLIKKIKASISL